MTSEDLKELGISSFGHRRRLLNAVLGNASVLALLREALPIDLAYQIATRTQWLLR
jgi:hypothetical protein